MSNRSHYPSYDVMQQSPEWDEHTRQIVSARTLKNYHYAYLTMEEAEALRSIAAILVDDDRAELIQYVLRHIDETLSGTEGEGQRKAGIPQAAVLVREGVRALERVSFEGHKQFFFMLDSAVKQRMVSELSEDALEPKTVWGTIPQKVFFQKLLTLTVESYYSHPQVWSEIGYGGPAYPRGYVRTGIGQLDPWEAKKE